MTKHINERMIQNALYRFRGDHQVIVPNINMPWGESDLLSVNRTGFIFDHEIKISRADFKADGGRVGKKIVSHMKWNKHQALRGAEAYQGDRLPNYFLYVAPAHLLTVHDVPSYAGHGCQCNSPAFGCITLVKKPPRLHDRKIDQATMQQLARALMFRYWNARQASDPTCPGVEVAA